MQRCMGNVGCCKCILERNPGYKLRWCSKLKCKVSESSALSLIYDTALWTAGVKKQKCFFEWSGTIVFVISNILLPLLILHYQSFKSTLFVLTFIGVQTSSHLLRLRKFSYSNTSFNCLRVLFNLCWSLAVVPSLRHKKVPFISWIFTEGTSREDNALMWNQMHLATDPPALQYDKGSFLWPQQTTRLFQWFVKLQATE